MNPLPIQKYVQYCMGFGYVDKRKYATDLSQQRSEQRGLQTQLDNLMRAIQDISLKGPAQPPPFPPSFTPPPNPLQRAFLAVFQPMQWVLNQVPQMLQRWVGMPALALGKLAGSVLEHTLGRIASFFFGNKKERTEERELRDKDDFSETDLFTKFTTHASSGGGQSGGR